ncbi:MAG: DUF2878 domain-containing protein [Planctomycetes bacterium]|nr:DUF2878 domain-containing protein [Planctomycetota bacterium]
MTGKLYNFAAFQAGWFACVLGAAHGATWLGPAAVALILAVHLGLARARRGEPLLLLASIPIGLAINTILQTTGAVVAPGPPTGPLWLLALWPLFASIFNESMSWMRGRYAAGTAFGVVGAPLSYWGGERAGALVLHERAAVWIPLVAATWAAAMLVLLWLQQRLTPRGGSAAHPGPVRA